MEAGSPTRMTIARVFWCIVAVSLLFATLAWQEPVTGVFSHAFAEDEALVVLPGGRFLLIPSRGEIINSEYEIDGYPGLRRLLASLGLHYDDRYGLRLRLPNDPDGTIHLEGWGTETIVWRDDTLFLGSWKRMSKDGAVAQAWERRPAR